MKKTIIALLALAGVAAAATVSVEDSSAALRNNDGDYALKGMTYTLEDDGDLLFTANEGISFAQQIGNYTTTTVAITLDFSKITLPTEASPLLTLGASTNIGLGYSGGKLTGIWDDNYAYYSTATLTGKTDSQTFVYTVSTNGTRVYHNDSATYWSSTGLKGAVGSVNSMTLADWAVEGLESITVWSGTNAYTDTALASSAFAANNKSLGVPEPATATLSLLALAGLAVRRRRK